MFCCQFRVWNKIVTIFSLSNWIFYLLALGMKSIARLKLQNFFYNNKSLCNSKNVFITTTIDLKTNYKHSLNAARIFSSWDTPSLRPTKAADFEYFRITNSPLAIQAPLHRLEYFFDFSFSEVIHSTVFFFRWMKCLWWLAGVLHELLT